MSETKRISKTNILMVLQSPTDAKVQVKNESHFSIEKNTSFYSEFDADSKYIEGEGKFELFYNDREGLANDSSK